MKKGIIWLLLLCMLLPGAQAEDALPITSDALPQDEVTTILQDLCCFMGIAELPEDAEWKRSIVMGTEDVFYRIALNAEAVGQPERIEVLFGERYRSIGVVYKTPEESETQGPQQAAEVEEAVFAFWDTVALNVPQALEILWGKPQNIIYFSPGAMYHQEVDMLTQENKDYWYYIYAFGGDGTGVYDHTLVELRWDPAVSKFDDVEVCYQDR